MEKAVWFISYKLVEGASVADFLFASEKTQKEVLAKKKGFISWQILNDGDTWVDLVTWETMKDAVNAESNDEMDPVAMEFYAFIEPSSLKMQAYSIKRN